MNKEFIKDFPVSQLVPYERNPRKCACGCGQIVSENKYKPRRFISGHNSWGRRKQYVKIKCINCNNIFEVPPAGKNRKFCSRHCRNVFRKTLIGEKSPYHKRIEVECGYCGKKFNTIPCRIKNGKIPYCSPKCGHTAQSIKIGILGKSSSKDGCWSFGKRAVLDRDNGKCVICEFDVVVHAHHIESRSDGGSNHLDNMVTLCPNHHAMVHKGIITKKELLKYIKDKKLK
ncbi:MAG: HNH endonuclease [Acidobacteria bacterium]|jgi:hypothetical protein|nr:HNH endonuclease [Acidobacteriota bacterium]